MTTHDIVKELPEPESSNMRHFVEEPTPEGENPQQRDQTPSAKEDKKLQSNDDHSKGDHAAEISRRNRNSNDRENDDDQ